MCNNFKNKAVRDLAWSVCSQGLLKDELVLDEGVLRDEYLKFEPQLIQWDRNPKPLVDFMNTKNTRRLGHYFEQLIFFWLQRSERFEIVANNIPLRTNKKHTLGEVDLIVYDEKIKVYQHWELAVKFYLAINTGGKTTYIGPNANDYLHLKIQKLKEHQCKILESEEGKSLLSELNIPHVQTKLFVKGFLYYHPKQACIPWENIHPDHARSWWIYLKEAEEFLTDTHQFALIHKDEWLSTPTLPKKILTKKECLNTLKQELELSPRSIYLTTYKNGIFKSSGFVVKDSWPLI